jgi:formylglycine-generating enzyme required for sulfatase activity
MDASRTGLLVGAMLVAALARPAVGGDCSEKELDAHGRCPTPAPPVRPDPPPVKPDPPPVVRPTPPLVKPTRIDVRGTEIEGGKVWLDGQSAGRAPLSLPTKPGRHHVEVHQDGYTPYSAWIEVKQGEQIVLHVKLVKLPPEGVAPPVSPPRSESCPPDMVRVSAGTFQMGSMEGMGDRSESPPHAVTLSGYCIDKTEVTVKAYRACVAAKQCAAADDKLSPHCNREDRSEHPINCVSWNQAAAYCKWDRKRLPTEAEWEYAARGDDHRKHPWGNGAPSAKLLNACGSECAAKLPRQRDGKQVIPMYDGHDGWETTAPVGRFPAGASRFGALDMAGNVWEWTADRHGDYSVAAVTDPQGPTVGATRVFRGGSWSANIQFEVRTTHRTSEMPTLSHDEVGFRCAR